MIKILLIGDTHIPRRARNIPKTLDECIKSESPYDYILFTGDLVEEKVLSTLKPLSKNIYVVRGNMDFLNLPEYQVVKIGNVKFGVIHGHQVYPRGDLEGLTRIALKLGVDILVSGHTHNPFATIYTIGGKRVIQLNPGSATGVWSGGCASMIPSYMTAVLYEDTIKVTLYEEHQNKIITKNFLFEV